MLHKRNPWGDSVRLNFRLFTYLTFGCTLLASTSVAALDFSAHGYYRTRLVANSNLDLQTSNTSIPNDNNRFGVIAYNQMRLRVEPNLKINDNLAIHSIFDFLDNVLYGTNDTRQLNVLSPVVGTLTLPAGAGSFWQTGGAAGENGSVNVRAIWGDIFTPIGLIRAGRQPSHWGLGIFQNDGRARQSDFGDMSDRILYLAQFDSDNVGAFSFGLAWDIPFEAQFDPRVQGLGGQVRSNAQDTNQYSTFVLYEQENVTAGVLGGFRRRNGPDGATTMTVTDATGASVDSGIDGNTALFFGDIYAQLKLQEYRFAFEGVYIGGKVTTGVASDGIAFNGVGAADPNNPCGTGGIICMPAAQPIQVIMGALEADATYKFGGEWNAKAGFAQGDANILSSKITQFGFRPDYQVALMMFNTPLGTSPSFYDSGSGEKLTGGVPVTGNYINNALYVSAGYKQKFEFSSVPSINWFKVGGQVTTAWAHQKNINVDFEQLTGTANLPLLTETASSMFKRWYGVEADLSAELQAWEHLYTVLDVGVLLPGKAYNVDVALTDPNSIVDPIPSDKAEISWMVRLTSSLEF